MCGGFSCDNMVAGGICMNDPNGIKRQEKIKEALEAIDELIRFNEKYNKPEASIRDLKEIKEILEK